MSTSIRALYPISGDPPTLGHANVTQRVAALFDEVVWALAVNPKKRYLFDLDTRLRMLGIYCDRLGLTGVRIAFYEGATVRYAQRIGARVIVKGIRDGSDLHAEQEQAFGNRGIDPQIDTFLLFADSIYAPISSSLVRELILLGEDVSGYLHPEVAKLASQRGRSQSKAAAG